MASLPDHTTTQRALELTASLPWEAKDVGSFHYSNSNYYALGQLLEKLRGKPYTQVLRDDVLTPIGPFSHELAGPDLAADGCS
jgi:D-alanyl-D-alanine carboxypeptidase